MHCHSQKLPSEERAWRSQAHKVKKAPGLIQRLYQPRDSRRPWVEVAKPREPNLATPVVREA